MALSPFLPLFKRIICILQLSIAFSALLWHIGSFWTEPLFSYREQKVLYQQLIGDPELLKYIRTDETILKRNQERFNALSALEKKELAEHYEQTEILKERPFWPTLKKAVVSLKELPFFAIITLSLSLLIPFLLLLKVEGASATVWLLPLTAALFFFQNQSLPPTPLRADAELVPKEHELINRYPTIFASSENDYQKLKKAWDTYLVEEWGKEVPSQDPSYFKAQVEKGDFSFQKSRFLKLSKETPHEKTRLSPFLAALFLLWNLFFFLKFAKAPRAERVYP